MSTSDSLDELHVPSHAEPVSPFDVAALTELANAVFREALGTPSVAGLAPNGGLSPNLGSPSPNVAGPSPNVAGLAPNVGNPTPNFAGLTAGVGSRSPNLAFPDVGLAPPPVSTSPNLGSGTPNPGAPTSGFTPASLPYGPTSLGSVPTSLPGAPRTLPVPNRSQVLPSPVEGRTPSDQLYFLHERSSQSATLPSPAQSTRTQTPLLLSPTMVPQLEPVRGVFDAASVRRDFPILEERVHGKPLIWLDNAATTQKPRAVIDRLAHFYAYENSNIHRAAHTLAARATDAYENAREIVRRFIHASSVKDIVFVRGATEAINLVAKSWGNKHIERGDEIILTTLEHHSNIVPWQQLAAEKGAHIRVAPVDDDGQILLDEYARLLNSRTRLVALTQVSNAMGTVTPAREMVELAHRYGAKVLVDGAQSVSHMAVDVQELGADFFVFSGHKVFGPTGIGVLYGTPEVFAASPPWQGGGNMIVDVTFEKTVYAPPPARFEAGTGNIADAVGLGAALEYLERAGLENVARHEHDLLVYGTEGLKRIAGVRLVGTAKEKAGVLSFVLDGCRSEDVGAALDREGIAVRSGHHCAQPALRRFGLETSVRPSLALYNTKDDLDALLHVVEDVSRRRGDHRR